MLLRSKTSKAVPFSSLKIKLFVGILKSSRAPANSKLNKYLLYFWKRNKMMCSQGKKRVLILKEYLLVQWV